MQSEKMNPRLLITFTVMLLSQSVLLAVSPLVTDDADTVEAGKLQLSYDFQFVRTSSTSFYLVPINPVLGLTPRLELGAIFGYQRRDGLHSSFCYAFHHSITLGFFRRDLAMRKGRSSLSPRPNASQRVSNSSHRCSSGSAVWLTGNSMISQGAVKWFAIE